MSVDESAKFLDDNLKASVSSFVKNKRIREGLSVKWYTENVKQGLRERDKIDTKLQ